MFFKSLSRKQIQTRFGQKEKYLITDENGKMYDSWCADWNKTFAEGQTVEIKPEQIQEREYNGKKYYTIIPLGSRRPQQIDLEPMLTGMQKLQDQLTRIEELLKRVEALLKDNQPTFP